MKKKLILLLLIVALLPIRTFASGIDDYKENDKQAVIYMFRGQGCGFCRAFLTFLKSITEEYGDYFKLVSYEVWNDEKNVELWDKVASVTGEEAGGVPYIVIGKKVFAGYATDGSYDDDIKKAIMDQYNNPSYDVVKETKLKASDYKSMNLIETLESEDLLADTPEEESETSKSTSSNSSFATIFWNAFFVIAGTVAIIVVNNKNTQKVLSVMEKKETKENKKK